MSFKFAARTILELGKELISSDEVALYELIKNAVDADSPRVEIAVNIQLNYSGYREAVARVNEEQRRLSDVEEYVRAALFDADSEASKQLLADLRESDSRSVFLEKLEAFYNSTNYIEVRDTGHGMSIDDLTNIFLRIGTHSRRIQNLAGARNLGDKGIGRLSAMRLGDRLQVKTTKSGERYWNLLDIDWTAFLHDDDIDAEEIKLEPEIGEEKLDRDEQGTTIRIAALRGEWDRVRFLDMLQGRIARMVDPFVPGSANRLIVARHNGTRVQIPSIPAALLRAAHAECQFEFRMEEDTPVLEGEINYRLRHRKRRLEAQGSEVFSLTQKSVKRRAKKGHAAYRLFPLRPSAFKRLGNFKCEMYWYNRRTMLAIEGLTDSMQATRDAIANWSGGPMLYRYGFRILPFGDPDDDWLGLDEIAFRESGFKLNRQQLIGRVSLVTPHNELTEKTDREGLIESDPYNALRRILMWVVHNEMRGLINEADKIEFIQRREAERETRSVYKIKARVDASLARLRERIGDAAEKEMEGLAQNVASLTKRSDELVHGIEAVTQEADEERQKFVYLAGIGLMTEFVFHELERAVSHTMDIIARGAVRKTTIESLSEQLKTLHKRIAAFDELTGEKRQRKSKFDLGELVGHTLENHIREFERHGIALHFDRPPSPFNVNAVRGMMIQILENLIVNSAYWLKQQKQFEPGFKPALIVSIDANANCLTVEDNGPGVIEDRRERIFQPYVTSKPPGQGRGLGLYISREIAEYHEWKLYMDDQAGRIREGRLNRFVLDMG